MQMLGRRSICQLGRKSFIRSFLVLLAMAISVAAIPTDSRADESPAVACDALLSAPYDPMRKSAAVVDREVKVALGESRCREAVVLNPREPRYKFLLARAIMVDFDWYPQKSDEVVSLLSSARAQGYLAADYLLGEYYYRRGGFMLPRREIRSSEKELFNKMIGSFQSYIGSVENNSWALIRLAKIYEQLGDSEEVLAYLNKAISQGNVQALTQKGRYLFLEGLEAEGISSLTWASTLGDGEADFWLSDFYIAGFVNELSVEQLVLSRLHLDRARKRAYVLPHVLNTIETKHTRILSKLPLLQTNYQALHKKAYAAINENRVFAPLEAVIFASNEINSTH